MSTANSRYPRAHLEAEMVGVCNVCGYRVKAIRDAGGNVRLDDFSEQVHATCKIAKRKRHNENTSNEAGQLNLGIE